MKKLSQILILTPVAVSAMLPMTLRAKEVARFTMENTGDKIAEVISGSNYVINSVHSAENVNSPRGTALRFDGYSTYIDGAVGNIIPAGSKKMTASVQFAIETYPIVEIDVNTTEQVAIASCIDAGAKTGFGFFVGFDGKYSFKTYIGGWPLELKVNTPLECYRWINLTAVIDTEARTATLYNNGEPVATAKANGSVTVTNSTMRIGRSFDERFSGPFCLTSFNGLIDEIAVWNEALSREAITAMVDGGEADMAVSVERFAGDPMRPSFHGMPGANWTNETHGLTYSNGRYHLFFQKNANGPYMSRLHWGHLSSDNLYDWTEEPVALTPGSPFDIKGCWSGCVFTDNQLTQGKPSIIYTGVDYGRAVIAQAMPLDDDLIDWEKSATPIINGRPDGLSDDFRDPYFFRSDNGAYIIVGSSKGGVGTTTLHAYNPATKTWSNDGKLFFTGSNASTCGTFWEMPNLTPMDGKWLFTVTPQNTSKGVATLYWVGTVNPDGTFTPDKVAPSNIELPGFARDGFGMLSPTIYRRDGKTIALGIVPDKLPSQANYDLGYAHTYSLPREWTLDADGNLCQKPYAELAAMRVADGFERSDFTLDGSVALDPVSGRALELLGEFTVGAGKCGFTLLGDGSSSLKVYYDGATNEIVIDARGVDRLINDAGVFDGYYRSSLPRPLAKGSKLKLNVFFDHSILDIFVNDTWASSVRVFAKESARESVTAFADSPNQVTTLRGWMLDVSNGGGAGIDSVTADGNQPVISAYDGIIRFTNLGTPATVAVYGISGNKLLERHFDSTAGSIDTGLNGFHIVSVTTPDVVVTRKLLL